MLSCILLFCLFFLPSSPFSSCLSIPHFLPVSCPQSLVGNAYLELCKCLKCIILVNLASRLVSRSRHSSLTAQTLLKLVSPKGGSLYIRRCYNIQCKFIQWLQFGVKVLFFSTNKILFVFSSTFTWHLPFNLLLFLSLWYLISSLFVMSYFT